jgi:hypothetical protein
MLGSTFLHAPDPNQLLRIVDDVDAIDDFEHVDMDGLMTLDLQSVCGNRARWAAAGPPVAFDEERGLAIFRIEPEGIAFVFGHRHEFDEEYRDDLDRLQDFVAKHGREHLYELTTF